MFNAGFLTFVTLAVVVSTYAKEDFAELPHKNTGLPETKPNTPITSEQDESSNSRRPIDVSLGGISDEEKVEYYTTKVHRQRTTTTTTRTTQQVYGQKKNSTGVRIVVDSADHSNKTSTWAVQHEAKPSVKKPSTIHVAAPVSTTAMPGMLYSEAVKQKPTTAKLNSTTTVAEENATTDKPETKINSPAQILPLVFPTVTKTEAIVGNNATTDKPETTKSADLSASTGLTNRTTVAETNEPTAKPVTKMNSTAPTLPLVFPTVNETDATIGKNATTDKPATTESAKVSTLSLLFPHLNKTATAAAGNGTNHTTATANNVVNTTSPSHNSDSSRAPAENPPADNSSTVKRVVRQAVQTAKQPSTTRPSTTSKPLTTTKSKRTKPLTTTKPKTTGKPTGTTKSSTKRVVRQAPVTTKRPATTKKTTTTTKPTTRRQGFFSSLRRTTTKKTPATTMKSKL